MSAVGSCFGVASIRSKLSSPCSSSLRLTCLQFLPIATAIACSHHLDSLSLCISPPKRWPFMLCSSVVQEDAAAAASVAESDAAENQEESGGEEQGLLQEEDVGSSTKLYFGNLPYNCDSARLAGIIQEHGCTPEMIEVLYDKDTGRSRGFAFVTMSSIEECNSVIENLDGCEYSGRPLRVNFSDKPKPRAPLYPETDYKLFVGNLSWSVSSESLTQAFQQYGNVVRARVLYDGDTGKSRGYGFVCYSTQEEMDAAIENLNGVELEGRPMRVSVALGKRS